MNKNVLIICDSDKNYCHKLDSYIRDNVSIPFNIFGITDNKRLTDFIDDSKNTLLLISETMFMKSFPSGFKHILVLKEKENLVSEKDFIYGNDGSDIRFVDKYQRSENITDSILSMCLDIPEIVVKGKNAEFQSSMKITGFYTPAHNSYQTIEALRFSRRLSIKESTLYINTDCFCTEELIRNDAYDETIADLMYFAECQGDKFGIYLERIVKHDKKLDFIPTSMSPLQSRMIKTSEYNRLIKRIAETGKYTNLIIDITDGVHDLFEMLKMCDELYVIQDEDVCTQMRIDMLVNELRKNDEFDIKKLHRIGKSGGETIGA